MLSFLDLQPRPTYAFFGKAESEALTLQSQDVRDQKTGEPGGVSPRTTRRQTKKLASRTALAPGQRAGRPNWDYQGNGAPCPDLA